MLSTPSTFSLLLVSALAASSSAFFVPTRAPTVTGIVLHVKDVGPDKQRIVDETSKTRASIDSFNIPNPFAELVDMFSNFDDVVDDFFNKRMGNGEVFYGKRKYKPSGKISSKYNGGGFSDRRKIDAARAFREERAIMRELSNEQKKAGTNDM